MFKRKVTINEKDFIGYDAKTKIRICKSCIKEAKRLLKSKKGDDKAKEIEVIQSDIDFMVQSMEAFEQGVILDNPTYSRLVEVLNKYYYKRYGIIILILTLLLILIFARKLTDDIPFFGFPVDDTDEYEAGTVETMQIPGYDTQIVDKKTKYVQLKNVENNSVYLKYYVYDENRELLYESQLIAPGNYCDRWNAYKDLKKGEHEISFDVKAYDSETTEECANAAVIPVKVIKK